jgi:hypothetical protein
MTNREHVRFVTVHALFIGFAAAYVKAALAVIPA